MHFNSADKNQWFAKEYLKSKKKITRGEKAIYKLEFFSVINKHSDIQLYVVLLKNVLFCS